MGRLYGLASAKGNKQVGQMIAESLFGGGVDIEIASHPFRIGNTLLRPIGFGVIYPPLHHLLYGFAVRIVVCGFVQRCLFRFLKGFCYYLMQIYIFYKRYAFVIVCFKTFCLYKRNYIMIFSLSGSFLEGFAFGGGSSIVFVNSSETLKAWVLGIDVEKHPSAVQIGRAYV